MSSPPQSLSLAPTPSSAPYLTLCVDSVLPGPDLTAEGAGSGASHPQRPLPGRWVTEGCPWGVLGGVWLLGAARVGRMRMGWAPVLPELTVVALHTGQVLVCEALTVCF